jgi:hypothetical protein
MRGIIVPEIYCIDFTPVEDFGFVMRNISLIFFRVSKVGP